MRNNKLRAKIIEIYGTQSDFAQILQIDEARVSQIVNNRRNLADEQKKLWAAILECDPAEIWTDVAALEKEIDLDTDPYEDYVRELNKKHLILAR